MSGGLTDRNGIPFGKWQDRFIEWFRDSVFSKNPAWKQKPLGTQRLSPVASAMTIRDSAEKP